MQTNIFSYSSNPPADQNSYYYKCEAVKEAGDIAPCKQTQTKSVEVVGLPRTFEKYNIHGGGVPYVPVTVEDIPGYFAEDSWMHCVTTIRTIGIVRRLERETYIIESINQSEEDIRVLLSRGTNRQLKVPARESKKRHKSKKKNENENAETNKPENKSGTKPKIKDLPFPDSVRDPSLLGDTRVEDGAAYIVLGNLRWLDVEPIIDVHRFIPVNDLKSTFESFMLQHAIARHHVDFYKGHPEEITEILRKPEEKRPGKSPLEMLQTYQRRKFP